MRREFTGETKGTEWRSKTSMEKQQRMQNPTCSVSFTLVFLQLGMLGWEEEKDKIRTNEVDVGVHPSHNPHLFSLICTETSCS